MSRAVSILAVLVLSSTYHRVWLSAANSCEKPACQKYHTNWPAGGYGYD